MSLALYPSRVRSSEVLGVTTVGPCAKPRALPTAIRLPTQPRRKEIAIPLFPIQRTRGRYRDRTPYIGPRCNSPLNPRLPTRAPTAQRREATPIDHVNWLLRVRSPLQ